jgi:outer membrane protein TolC
MHTPRPASGRTLLALGLAACAALAVACSTSKLRDRSTEELRRAVREANRRELEEARARPEPLVTGRTDSLSNLNISPAGMAALERLAGPRSYDRSRFTMPPDLTGQPQRTGMVTLERAVKSSLANNLAVQFARLGPAVSETEVVRAEAAFDWTFFSGASAGRTDSPQIRQGFFGLGVDQRDTAGFQAGVRRQLTPGGRFTIQQDYQNVDVRTPGFNANPNPSNQVGVLFQYEQPLLRGLGSDVNLAEVRIARNAERAAVQTLQRDLMRVLTESERAYWQLQLAQGELLVLERLLDRGRQKRDQLKAREAAQLESPSVLKDAAFRVTDRESGLLRAQTALKIASDSLKRIMNDPEYPLGSELLLTASDKPLDQPLRFNLADAILSAIDRRPEVQQAVLSIDDATIRYMVARSARLPQLDLRLQARFNQLTDDMGSAYRDVFAGEFVDTLVALTFEQPLGGRAGEAQMRRRQFERSQAGIAYMDRVQEVVSEVKESLNRVVANYQLIQSTRQNRIAAAEVLRATTVENELVRALSAERLDIELNRQERLAQAERDELRALVDYNIAVADLFLAMGLTLERNRVAFDAPRLDDPQTPGVPPRGEDPWWMIDPASSGADAGPTGEGRKVPVP